MSYDVSLEVEGREVFWRNHTSNTAPMWRRAGIDLAECDGHPAAQVAEGLAVAYAAITEAPDTFRDLEPENGWGTVETTLAFLRETLDACVRYPGATMVVSR